MVLHALFWIAQDAVVDAEQVGGLDDESGFFAGLADGGFADEFSDFEDSSGNGPLSLQRRVSAFDEEDAGVLDGLFDDDGADTDQREFGEFALHVQAFYLRRAEQQVPPLRIPLLLNGMLRSG